MFGFAFASLVLQQRDLLSDAAPGPLRWWWASAAVRVPCSSVSPSAARRESKAVARSCLRGPGPVLDARPPMPVRRTGGRGCRIFAVALRGRPAISGIPPCRRSPLQLVPRRRSAFGSPRDALPGGGPTADKGESSASGAGGRGGRPSRGEREARSQTGGRPMEIEAREYGDRRQVSAERGLLQHRRGAGDGLIGEVGLRPVGPSDQVLPRRKLLWPTGTCKLWSVMSSSPPIPSRLVTVRVAPNCPFGQPPGALAAKPPWVLRRSSGRRQDGTAPALRSENGEQNSKRTTQLVGPMSCQPRILLGRTGGGLPVLKVRDVGRTSPVCLRVGLAPFGGDELEVTARVLSLRLPC